MNAELSYPLGSHVVEGGGEDDGTLAVSIERFYGSDYVCMTAEPGMQMTHLKTADVARAVAADLLALAGELDRRGTGWR